MTALEFNRNFLVRVSTPFYSGLASYNMLSILLEPKFDFVLNRVENQLFRQKNSQKLIVRPFHGEVYTFIHR